jgi:integrase
MKFQTRAVDYLKEIQSRRRSPVREATIRIYQSYLDAHILSFFHDKDLHLIENGVVKQFIAHLSLKNLAPTTVNQIFNLVTAVIASDVDLNGNQKCPRTWNHDFIDLPVVNKDCNAPIVTPEQINTSLLQASGQLQAMLVLLAASGARVGEALAINRGLKGSLYSSWDSDRAVISIKTTLVKGKVSPQPKTDAGNREIDLHPTVNDFLKRSNLPKEGFLFQNSLGDRARVETLYSQLEDLGLDTGFHAFRRFRATHLESQNVPRSLTSYWLGHSSNSITDRYIKIGQDLQTRKDWAQKAGYGFELPKGMK